MTVNTIKIWGSLLWLMNATLCLVAQDFSSVSTENKTYMQDIKTVELYLDGFPYSQPVITINSDEKLILSFDDLSGESRYLKYTFIHCSHDWKIDGLSQMEYLSGFMEDEVTEYSYSFNTIIGYTNYQINFPGSLMQITKSGNYILYVYDDTPDNPILTRRFMVMESRPIMIGGEVRQASDVSVMHTKQEVDFVAYTAPYNVKNPARYLHANIVQNGRWDNAIIGLKYRSGKPGEYSFDYDLNENSFNGGDDFRIFDIKSLRYNGSRIVSVGYRRNENMAFVVEDYARPYGAYESNPTLQGYYYIKNEDFSGVNTEDYVRVYFTLKTDFNVQGGDLYVFGGLTDWKIQEDAKMKLNPNTGLWETSLLLKQGFYNYQYVQLKSASQTIDETYIEGSHWETKNKYTIFVYLQDEGTVYDKLIGTLELIK